MIMGIGPFHKSSFSRLEPERCSYSVEQNPGNPDPKNYSIVRHNETKHSVLVLINYPDCHNYEGNKILLFLDTTLEKLKSQKYIDPHFSNISRFKHPFARFEPTDFGWLCGKRMQLYLEESLGGFK
jgi:hypothetical protein